MYVIIDVMIVILKKKATKEQIIKASEEFKTYIKIVADIEKEIVAIGGKFHADAEKILLENGSLQDNLWGGGLDLLSGKTDMQAIINIRPSKNNDSMEILDPKIRDGFNRITEKFLK